MGPTVSPETSAFKLQTPGKFPEEYKLHYCFQYRPNSSKRKTMKTQSDTLLQFTFHLSKRIEKVDVEYFICYCT